MKKVLGNFWLVLGLIGIVSLFFPPPQDQPANKVRVKQACLSALCLCAGCAFSRNNISMRK